MRGGQPATQEPSKPKAKSKAKVAPHGSPSEVEGKDNQPPPAEWIEVSWVD